MTISAAPIGSQGDIEVMTIYNQNEGRVIEYNIECVIFDKANRSYAMCVNSRVLYPLFLYMLATYIMNNDRE